MIRGTMPGMKPGTILGHEGVGVVEETGRGVRNLSPGDRVVIPSTIVCGNTAEPGTTRNATTRIRSGRWPEPRFSAARRRPVLSTVCRPSTHGFHSRTSVR
jgi:threonine dehydrogenase-like Zn-dependent dehydrogenase